MRPGRWLNGFNVWLAPHTRHAPCALPHIPAMRHAPAMWPAPRTCFEMTSTIMRKGSCCGDVVISIKMRACQNKGKARVRIRACQTNTQRQTGAITANAQPTTYP